MVGNPEVIHLAEQSAFRTSDPAPYLRAPISAQGSFCRYTLRRRDLTMADIDLAQDEADVLIALEKHRVD